MLAFFISTSNFLKQSNRVDRRVGNENDTIKPVESEHTLFNNHNISIFIHIKMMAMTLLIWQNQNDYNNFWND